jgi:two-component system sensor histidine kinase GlrK
MVRLHRLSFRQLLLLAFLSVAALLAAVSLRGLFALENLIAQSRSASAQAVALTAAAQRLAEVGVAMERAARQYLVLDDAPLRRRFDEARAEATAVLDGSLAPQPGRRALARTDRRHRRPAERPASHLGAARGRAGAAVP